MKKNKLPLPRPSKFRKYWRLAPGTVFLNHGSFGACPAPVLALQAKLRLQMEAEPIQFLWRHYEERLEPSRAELARFLGARSKDLVFVTNATTGVNAVVRSLKIRPGDELLTTDHDYNACRNVLIEAAARTGAKVVIAPTPFPVRNEIELIEAVLSAVTKRTRLAMIDHVASHTALVYPLAKIIRELEARGVDTLVDGAHAPGALPVNLGRLRPAYYTGNLHKWVCAPKGAAFLWTREDKQSTLQPGIISHGNNTPRVGYSQYQDRFDWGGTFDPTAWFCVGDAIRWANNLLPGGWDEIRRRNHQLATDARKLLCAKLELEPPCPEHMLSSMAVIPLPERFQGRPKNGRIDAEQLRLYDDFGIEVPFVRIGAKQKRYLRVSAHLHNTLGDYEYLAEAIKRI